MPDIQAFRGVRYDLGHVGSLGGVVAPPYDVISPDDQTELYNQHAANCVRLILNRSEPGDEDVGDLYRRAARFFKEWQRQGVLFTEADPAIYVYHQEFTYGGDTHTRRGFMARVRLQRFGEGDIYPHEETMSGPKEDRLRLMTACKANLSPVFGLFPDQENAAQTILDRVVLGATPLVATDLLGVVHRLWPVMDVGEISALTGAMGGKPMFIADGHHRYETACNYRDQLAAAEKLDRNHPANFVLMMCVAMSDPGMVVFPTHRLFRGLPAMTSSELAETLGESFECTPAEEGGDGATAVWEIIQIDGQQGTLGLFTAQDGRWSLARLTDAGRSKMNEAAADRSDDWRSLGVSILHRLVIETLLKATDLPKPTYVHQIDEVIQQLASEQYSLAALVQPPSLESIESVSRQLDRMPAKSTYFYPKLLSGLVFNPLQ